MITLVVLGLVVLVVVGLTCFCVIAIKIAEQYCDK